MDLKRSFYRVAVMMLVSCWLLLLGAFLYAVCVLWSLPLQFFANLEAVPSPIARSWLVVGLGVFLGGLAGIWYLVMWVTGEIVRGFFDKSDGDACREPE